MILKVSYTMESLNEYENTGNQMESGMLSVKLLVFLSLLIDFGTTV